MLRRTVKVLTSPGTLFGYLGAVVLLLMMLFTTSDVVARYLFNKPIRGSYEITEFMIAMVVFCFLGYTQRDNAHVTVDLVVDRLPRKQRLLVDLCVGTVSLAVMGLIVVMTVVRGLELHEIGEYTGTLQVPLAPFFLMTALGCAAMCVEMAKHLFRLRKKDSPSA